MRSNISQKEIKKLTQELGVSDLAMKIAVECDAYLDVQYDIQFKNEYGIKEEFAPIIHNILETNKNN